MTRDRGEEDLESSACPRKKGKDIIITFGGTLRSLIPLCATCARAQGERFLVGQYSYYIFMVFVVERYQRSRSRTPRIALRSGAIMTVRTNLH